MSSTLFSSLEKWTGFSPCLFGLIKDLNLLLPLPARPNNSFLSKVLGHLVVPEVSNTCPSGGTCAYFHGSMLSSLLDGGLEEIDAHKIVHIYKLYNVGNTTGTGNFLLVHLILVQHNAESRLKRTLLWDSSTTAICDAWAIMPAFSIHTSMLEISTMEGYTVLSLA